MSGRRPVSAHSHGNLRKTRVTFPRRLPPRPSQWWPAGQSFPPTSAGGAGPIPAKDTQHPVPAVVTEPIASTGCTILPHTATTATNIVQHDTRRMGDHPPFPSEDNAFPAPQAWTKAALQPWKHNGSCVRLRSGRLWVRIPPEARGTSRSFTSFLPAQCQRGVRTTVSATASQAVDAGPTPARRSKGRAIRAAKPCIIGLHAARPGYAGSPTVGPWSPKP